jgi:translation initiation factor 2 alpha subunit (eIF-2alpha)
MINEEEIVLCTVKKIDGATIFVEIEGNGEGSIALPEIAAGRIRNLREYVSPNKKIVCKVLKIINGHPQLSLRRVTAKEREEVMQKYNKNKNLRNLLKSSIKDYEKIISSIKEKYDLAEFYDLARENPSLLEKFVDKKDFENLKKIFSAKKEKEKEIKREFELSTMSESGLSDIKEILSLKEVEIKYIGSSRFSISTKAKEFKDASAIIQKSLLKIEERAKQKKMHFKLIEQRE